MKHRAFSRTRKGGHGKGTRQQARGNGRDHGVAGADTMAASLFMEKIASEQERISNRIDKFNKAQKGPTLGDLFDISGAKK